MAFPAVVGSGTPTVSTASETSLVISLPGSIASGDRLLMVVVLARIATFDAVAGWTELLDANTQSDRIAVLERIADGTEGSTVTVTINAASHWAARVFRMTSAHASTASAVAGPTNGTSANPNPPSLDPAGWATEDTLWFVAEQHEGPAATVSSYPTNYTGGTLDISGGTGVSATSLAIARRELNAGAEDPGTFTLSAAKDHGAITIAVRPGTADQSIAFGTVVETDAAQVIAVAPGGVSAQFGTAIESDAAQTFALSGGFSSALGTVTESDQSQAWLLVSDQSQAWGTALEVSSAQVWQLTFDQVIAFGTVLETDTVIAWTPLIVAPPGPIPPPTLYVVEVSGGVATSHKIARLIEVLADGEVIYELTEAVEGGVTFDSGAASRGRLELRVAGIPELIPTDAASLLAPYGNEIRVSRGVEYDDRAELVRMGVYRIDRATASSSNEGPTVNISGLDRSARFVDAAFEHDGQIASGTNAATAILEVLQEVWPEIPYDFVGVTVNLPKLAYDEGEDRWAFAQGIAIAIGGELFFSDDGTLLLRPIPLAGEGDPVAIFAEGEEGALLGAERDWDRAPVSNKVVVTGENTSLAEGSPIPRGVAIDDNVNSPTYYYGKFGRKPLFWASSYISESDQAEDAAAGILARTTGAPDIITFTSVVDPARRPSDVIRVVRAELGLAEDHVLDSVTIGLGPEAEMSGQTRATAVIG